MKITWKDAFKIALMICVAQLVVGIGMAIVTGTGLIGLLSLAAMSQ